MNKELICRSSFEIAGIRGPTGTSARRRRRPDSSRDNATVSFAGQRSEALIVVFHAAFISLPCSFFPRMLASVDVSVWGTLAVDQALLTSSALIYTYTSLKKHQILGCFTCLLPTRQHCLFQFVGNEVKALKRRSAGAGEDDKRLSRPVSNRPGSSEPPAGPPALHSANVSSPPTSGFWQSSGLAPAPLRFCSPARQQVSHLAVAGGAVSSFSTGDPHSGEKKGFYFLHF